MAIEFLGFTVWIDCEDKELPEYEVQVEDENTVSCYIASEVGKEFKIGWINKSPLAQCVVACYMDGRPVGGKPSARTQAGGIDGVYTAAGTMRPFKFSPVVTTDDDDIADPDGVDPDLGSLQIEVHRVAGRGDAGLRADHAQNQARGRVLDIGPVHERSKKLGAHHVALGDAVHRPDGRRPQFLAPTYAPNLGPYAVFRFLYRPREILLARGFMPPPVDDGPKPVVKSEPREAEPGPSQPRSSRGAGRNTRQSQETAGRPRSQIIKVEPKEHTLTAGERRKVKRRRTRSKQKQEDNTHVEQEALSEEGA